jgi:DNA-binding transcriptional regulator YiaG
MTPAPESDFDQRLEVIQIDEEVCVPALNPNAPAHRATVSVPAKRDPLTGEVYLGDEATELLDKAHAHYRWLLTNSELRALRKTHGLTQTEIARLLQLGEKTWARWESGREYPSRALNLLILALYEGKIDRAWLESKLPEPGQRMPAPILCSTPNAVGNRTAPKRTAPANVRPKVNEVAASAEALEVCTPSKEAVTGALVSQVEESRSPGDTRDSVE